MIKIQTRNRHIYKIYESVNEAEADNIAVKNWEDARLGDYVNTSNGYIVPVTKYEVLTKNKSSCVVRLTFPNGCYYISRLNYSSNRFSKTIMYWHRDIHNISTGNLSPHQKLFGIYLSKGFDVFTAYKLSYRIKDRKRSKNHILELLSKPTFINYLGKLGMFKSLKEAMYDIGMDAKWLATELKNIIEGDSNPNLKKYALELIKATLEQEGTVKSEPVSINPYRLQERGEIINKLLKSGTDDQL